MNTKRTLKWSLVGAAAACALVATMPGCELLVDFDRSKIPSEAGSEDGTTGDGPVGEDTGTDTGTDTSPADAPNDTTMRDASEASTGDAPSEAADAPSEATMNEGGGDAPAEAAPEGGTEAGPEGGGMEAGVEAGPEGGTDASEASTGSPVFTITPAALDYGTVTQGATTAGYTFTVTNSGTAGGTPTINKGGTNAGDFTTSGCTSIVLPTTSCTLTVTFTPGGTGVRAATVDVGSGTPAALTGSGAASGTLGIAPTTQDFGAVNSGTSSAEFAFTVTNSDAVNAVTLGNATIDGQDGPSFAVDSDGGANQCSGTLAAGGTCTLFLHFAPSVAGKSYYGSLTIGGTATDGGSAPGTASASLTGRSN